MRMFFLVLLLACSNISSALPWAGPQQTGARKATATANWSPAPTYHSEPFHDALKRSLFPVSVCGWIGGKADLPAYCSISSSCVWNSDYKIVGCCATASSECKFYTSCLDLNSPDPIGNRDDVYTCKGVSLCYSNRYPGGYSQWGCGKREWATSVLTSFSGMGAVSLQLVTTGNARSTSKDPLSHPLDSGTRIRDITGTPDTSTASAPEETRDAVAPSSSPPMSSGHISTTTSSTGSASNPASSFPPTENSNSRKGSKSTVPTGPVAGGVVAGIALFSFLGLFLFLACRRGWFHTKQELTGSEEEYSPAVASPPKEPMEFRPMEGTINLDSNPIYEMEGSTPGPVVSPMTQNNADNSLSVVSPMSNIGESRFLQRSSSQSFRMGSTAVRESQWSDVSKLSELPSGG
ncbi:hypothetical protein B0O99DRAFT_686719 [Bisporella sp. PMI_857]|nr:hypothetical protein B0O99DRAFT_686719 [Bisporella sp. PMI_857]